jgi:hypothetical protein
MSRKLNRKEKVLSIEEYKEQNQNLLNELAIYRKIFRQPEDAEHFIRNIRKRKILPEELLDDFDAMLNEYVTLERSFEECRIELSELKKKKNESIAEKIELKRDELITELEENRSAFRNKYLEEAEKNIELLVEIRRLKGLPMPTQDEPLIKYPKIKFGILGVREAIPKENWQLLIENEFNGELHTLHNGIDDPKHIMESFANCDLIIVFKNSIKHSRRNELDRIIDRYNSNLYNLIKDKESDETNIVKVYDRCKLGTVELVGSISKLRIFLEEGHFNEIKNAKNLRNYYLEIKD